jgi:hypothetical protein
VTSGADVVSVAKNPFVVLVFVAALPSLVVITPVGMILPWVVVPDGLDVSVTTGIDDPPVVVGTTVPTVVGITVSEVTGNPCVVLLSVAVVGTTTEPPDDVTDVTCCAGGLVVGTSVLETVVGASVTTDGTVGVRETEADGTVVAVSVPTITAV